MARENLPPGGFLLLPNHISWVDAIVLQLACPRPIRYIIDQEFYRKPLLRSVFAWRLHSHRHAPCALRDPRCGRRESRRRDRLSFSRRPTHALRNVVAFAARLRIDCATGQCAGRSGLARSTLGLDLFFQGGSSSPNGQRKFLIASPSLSANRCEPKRPTSRPFARNCSSLANSVTAADRHWIDISPKRACAV